MILALAALVTALATIALAVSVCAHFSAHKSLHAAKQAAETVRAECASAIEAAQSRIDAVEIELHSMKSLTPAGIFPGMPKPGMNLTRRTNALRLRREGAAPEQIAAALEVPRQEVDLLLKVHEIVLNNL
jgi:hypothetical protein